jgi:hypothetical protein
MNILLKIIYLQLMAKACFSFFKFNPRLFRGNPFREAGAINPHYSRAQPLIFYLTGHY